MAVKDMEDAVNELNQTVGLATFQSARMLSEVIQQMNENIDERMEAIKLDTKAIIEQNTELKSKQDAMIEMQRGLLEKLKEPSQLFNTTIQSFRYVHMGANFGRTFRVSLLKFDVVRLRLARWGHSAGLVGSDGVESLQATTLAFKNREQIQNLLDQILDLFADARVASKKFEKRNGNSAMPALDPAEELDGVSALLHQKMQDLVEKRQGKPGLEQSEWTLHEEKKFSRLIEDISELVDDLIDLFPGIQEEQRRLCEKEVSEMNMNKGMLLLLKDIAAGQDKLLSDTAAKAIKPTTTYTNSVVFSSSHNSGLQIGNNSGSISVNGFEIHLADSPQDDEQRTAQIRRQVLLKQINGQRVKRGQVSFEGVFRESGVSLQHVDDNWSPRNNVPLLALFYQHGVSRDDVLAEWYEGSFNIRSTLQSLDGDEINQRDQRSYTIMVSLLYFPHQ
ncbi:hypothetical protein Trihar35433_2985 [Trichoderma harzianum]|nr:hypothetical protein Trihar35433_2985 [Trichoderma harzianum]